MRHQTTRQSVVLVRCGFAAAVLAALLAGAVTVSAAAAATASHPGYLDPVRNVSVGRGRGHRPADRRRGWATAVGHVLRESVGFQLAAQGATLDSLTSRVMTIAPVGDQHSAHLVTVRISAGATKATAYADIIFIRVGRAVAGFSLGGVGQIFDSGLQMKLAKAVAGRLASGLGAGS